MGRAIGLMQQPTIQREEVRGQQHRMAAEEEARARARAAAAAALVQAQVPRPAPCNPLETFEAVDVVW